MFRLLTILLLLATFASGEDKIWSAMIYASEPMKGQKANPPPADLADYSAKLKKVFGFSQFEILGSATKTMGAGGQEKWLVPSPTFLVGAVATKDGSKGYKLNLDLFQGQKRIIQTQAKLGLQSPLFISGPRHGQGQLIIVFEIRP